jgi:hypothetical protein
VKHPDLFDQPDVLPQSRENPSAEIVAFPLNRDVGRARRIAAAILKRRSPVAQQGEFERQAAAIATKLRAAGIVEAEITRQIAAFTGAVNAELERRQHDGSRQERM